MILATPPKIQNPTDLLSVVPLTLGYQPAESMLVICIRHNGGLGMVARTSLSDIHCLKAANQISEMVSRNAVEDGAEQAFIVYYTSDTGEQAKQHLRNLTQVFQGRLESQDVECQVWLIDDTGYQHLVCDYDDCCPPNGYPLIDLESTAVRATLVYQGYAAADSRAAYLKLKKASEKDRKLAQEGAVRFEERKKGRAVNWRFEALTAWLFASELVRHKETIPPRVLGMLGAALTETTVRDAVLMACIPGGLSTAAALLEEHREATHTTREILESIVRIDDAIAPSSELCRTATQVLSAVAAHADGPRCVVPLTLLGFLAWWSGDGTRANTRLEEATLLDSEYQFAQVLTRVQRQYLRPGWLRARAREAVRLRQKAAA